MHLETLLYHYFEVYILYQHYCLTQPKIKNIAALAVAKAAIFIELYFNFFIIHQNTFCSFFQTGF